MSSQSARETKPRQGRGRRKHLETIGTKAGTFLHGDKKTNWQRTEEPQGLYQHTYIQAPGEGDQGGGLNHTSREGDLEREER